MLNRLHSQKMALLATQVLCEGSAFLRNLLLARLVGADEMGLAVALALAIRIFEMAGEFGLDRLLMQVEDEALSAMRRNVHLLQLVKGVALFVIAMLLAVPVSLALNPAVDPSMFSVAALALAIRGASNFEFRERQRRGDYLAGLVVEGGSALATALLTAPLAWALRDYTAMAWVLMLHAVVYCVLSHTIASSSYRIGFDRTLCSRCLRYGAPIALNGALMFLALQGDRLVVALHFPAAELAGFALAAQLTLLPALIGTRYLLAAELPRIARLSRKQAGIGSYCMTLLHRVGLVSLVGALLLGLGGNVLVGLLYGEAYQVEPPVFWLLAVAAGIRLVRAVPSTAFMALERTHFLFMSNLPRLVTLPVALWSAANGGGLVAIVAIAVVGEALSLIVGFTALAFSGPGVVSRDNAALAEGL